MALLTGVVLLTRILRAEKTARMAPVTGIPPKPVITCVWYNDNKDWQYFYLYQEDGVGRKGFQCQKLLAAYSTFRNFGIRQPVTTKQRLLNKRCATSSRRGTS